MAKSKTSQQENLTSKTGINVMTDLGFNKVTPKVTPMTDTNTAEEIKVDNLAQVTIEAQPESAKLSQESTSTETANTDKKPSLAANNEKPMEKPGKRSKLKRPDNPNSDEEMCKISANISVEAKANLEKYAKIYGYKKMSPFLNDILERLDLYLDE